MRLAFSSNAFRGYDLPQVVKILAQAGYHGIELMCDRPHLWPYDVTQQNIREILSCLSQHGLSISNLNAFMMCAVGDFYHPSWIEPDPDARRARAEYTLACLNLAYQLKAPSISTEPGGPIPPGISREDAMHTFRQGLSLVLPEAQKLGIKLLIEPEPGLLVQNLYEFEELADSIASPALGLNLDLGHFYCLGQDLRLIIKHLKGRIDHIHLEDIGADRRHLHLIPGRGAIEFALIFEALEEINYSGWITIELYPYQETATEAAREALQFVTRILQRS